MSTRSSGFPQPSGRASVPIRRSAGRARVREAPPPVEPPPTRVRRQRPRWRRIALVVLVVSALLLGLSVVALLLYARGLDNNMDRTDAFSLISGERPPETVTGSLNLLLLGSDSRDPAGDSAYRADTIMLLHVPSHHAEAYLISLPRDLWVHVPPTADGTAGGHEAKLNAATAYGGVPLAVHTVENFTGVRIDHVAMIDFGGFVEVTDALGGVELDIDQTITSIHAPHRTFEAGRNHLDGTEALDYIRQRYQFADGDFARMRNQQQFLRALMDKAVSSGTLTNPGKLHAFLQTATRTLTVDQDFSLVSVGWQFRALRSDNLHFLTCPHLGTSWMGDQSVVIPDLENSAALFRAIQADQMAEWAATNLDQETGISG